MKFWAFVVWCLLPVVAFAQEKDFTVQAPVALVETGFLKHLLPRFSLKHGVRVTQVATDGDVVIGTDGLVVFTGLDQTWHLTTGDGQGPALFAAWLTSDIGKRTIESFKIDGAPIFSGPQAVEAVVPERVFTGDIVAGEQLSLTHCGRCHVINDTNRMKGMGQTPSFALMRTFADWQTRFDRFYALNPHPSFSQVAGLTPPFAANLPPAIVPIEITQAEHAAILAYVTTIPPADLGAPLQNQ